MAGRLGCACSIRRWGFSLEIIEVIIYCYAVHFVHLIS